MTSLHRLPAIRSSQLARSTSVSSSAILKTTGRSSKPKSWRGLSQLLLKRERILIWEVTSGTTWSTGRGVALRVVAAHPWVSRSSHCCTCSTPTPSNFHWKRSVVKISSSLYMKRGGSFPHRRKLRRALKRARTAAVDVSDRIMSLRLDKRRHRRLTVRHVEQWTIPV